jgi:hypothetical protein
MECVFCNSDKCQDGVLFPGVDSLYPDFMCNNCINGMMRRSERKGKSVGKSADKRRLPSVKKERRKTI